MGLGYLASVLEEFQAGVFADKRMCATEKAGSTKAIKGCERGVTNMSPFYLGLLAGIFIGAFIGVIFFAFWTGHE